MMRVIHVILILISSVILHAQGFNLRHDYNDQQAQDFLWDVELLPDGYLLFGGATDTTDYSLGLWTLKIDFDGNKLLESAYFADSAYLYGGWANGTDKINNEMFITGGNIATVDSQLPFLALSNSDCDTLWLKVYEVSDSNAFIISRCTMVSESGDLFLGGVTNEPGYVCGILLKANPQGEEVWRKCYGSETQRFDLTSLAKDPSGSGYLIGGQTREEGTTVSYDGYIIKTDNEGNVEWEMPVADQGYNDAAAHVVCPYDNIYLIAGSSAIGNAFADYSEEYLSVSAVNQDGDLIYSRVYGDHNWQNALTSIKHVDQSGFIAAGYYNESANQVGVLLRLNELGDSLWLRKYHLLEGNYCYFRDVMPTLDGGFIAVGDAYPDQDAGVGFDGWVVKTDAYGCVVPGCQLAIEDIHTNVEVSVYPNPASDFTNVYVKTRDPGVKGVIQLFDELGNLLLTKAVIGGDLNIAIDVSSWPIGMYVLKYTNEQDELVVSKVLVER